MPIPGLKTQLERFPKIGDIRKGAPKGKDGRVGADLDYFRYVPLEGEEEAAARFHEVFGDEPREIEVVLPFDEIERNLAAYMERHTAGALQCRGDIEGGTAHMWRDKKGEMHHTPKECPSPSCKGCKEVGRLNVIIPALRRFARVEVHTTSKWDIIELYGNLRALRKMTGNGLKGIPLVLKRRPRTVSTPRANGKRVRQEKWFLSLEADPEYVEAQLQAMAAEALPGTETPAVLPATVDAETGEISDDWEAEEEAPSSFTEDGGPLADAEEGPSFPIALQAFCELAVEKLGYDTSRHVIEALKAGGIWPVSDEAGDCFFDGADGWAILQGAAA